MGDLLRLEVHLDVLAGLEDLLRGLPGTLIEDAVAYDAEFDGPVVAVDDVVEGVDHRDAHGRQRGDVLQHLRHRHAGCVGSTPLSAGHDAGRDGGAHRHADDQREERHERRQQ